MTKEPLRRTLQALPSVDKVVRVVLEASAPASGAATGRAGAAAGTPGPAPDAIARAARLALARLRSDLSPAETPSSLPALSREDLLHLAVLATSRVLEAAARPSLRRVINATGVVLHTNLGRARLAPEAVLAVSLAGGHVNLELELADGERASRQGHTRSLLTGLTGAEDALVVNNNAAAVWLVLRHLARGRSVVISRGELVEIGESFRLPDIMAEAGVSLLEVGTTNRTTAEDYRRALAGPVVPAAVVLVHPSNYRIVGFASRPPRAEVVALARAAGVPVLEDLGSGLLLELGPLEATGEPMAREALAEGVAVVTFSGDKLLGGPQCGVIAGNGRIIADLRAEPILRCLRPDKLTLAALEATLRLYASPQTALSRVPVLRALTEPAEVVRRRAARTLRLIRRRLAVGAQGRPAATPAASGAAPALKVVASTAEAGGGSLPGAELPSWAIRLEHPGLGADEAWRRLASADPPVIGRRHGQALLLDFRSVGDDEVDTLARVVGELLELAGGGYPGVQS
jgi:L-seryl-tRNA(Ser) seleniumtransferase